MTAEMTRDEWHDLFQRAREVARESYLSLEEAVLLEIERAGYRLVKR